MSRNIHCSLQFLRRVVVLRTNVWYMGKWCFPYGLFQCKVVMIPTNALHFLFLISPLEVQITLFTIQMRNCVKDNIVLTTQSSKLRFQHGIFEQSSRFSACNFAKRCNHLDLSLAKIAKKLQSFRFIASKKRNDLDLSLSQDFLTDPPFIFDVLKIDIS